jgi:hypothetical protein
LNVAVHDWTVVDAGIVHDFHTVWIGQIRTALNEGLLPEGYYALAEQHAGETIADVLTLHASRDIPRERSLPRAIGGTLVTEAPPQVARHHTLELPATLHPRTIAVRHVSGHQLVGMIEIVSPANKDRAKHVEAFATKAADALQQGVHLLVIDLFPPGQYDPYGIHGVIRQRLAESDDAYDLPSTEPLTLAAYAAGPRIDVYLEHLRAGARLREMPLFLERDRYVNVPLEFTYDAAYRGVPAVWRDVLEKANKP